jgi:stage II sporulation protein E
MNEQKFKQVGLYLVVALIPGIPIAGCYPLLPGIFAAIFMEEVNRTLLLTFSLFGMALLLPVQAMAKYGLIILIVSVTICLYEWINKKCLTWVGAATAGGSTLLLMIVGEFLQIRNRPVVWMGIVESAFVFSFVILVEPLLHMFLDGVSNRQPEPRKRVNAPENGARLHSYAESFQGLSRLFSQMSQYKSHFAVEEMSKMQQEITGKLCISCNQCALCWEQETSPMYQLFGRLLQSIEKLGNPDREIQAELSEHCLYSQAVVEEAAGIFEKARLNLAWYNRLLENREVIAQQLDAMAYIMTDCAKEYTDISHSEGKMLAAVRYRLKEQGIITNEIRLFEKQNHRLSLQLRVSSKWGNCISVREVAKALGEGLHKPMIAAKNSKTIVGRDEATLVFEEEPKFYTLNGVARLPKDGAQISGDNFSFLNLEVGQSVLTLSDGMGSGIKACKESEMVIELIEKFLEAGFQKETAIRMMNSAMVMHGDDGMYSTVDMASIDLYNGMCDFYKIGATTTFIKHGETVETVSSANLPAGLFQHIEIEKSSRQLRHGDFLVLVSDGVLDYLQVPSPETTIIEMLETIEISNPSNLAKYILEAILLFTGGNVPDDMTVLVTGMWEK